SSLTYLLFYSFPTRRSSDLAAKMVDDFHPEAIRRLINHYEEDYRTIIVSGAYTPLLEAAMEPFPVDKIIGTDIPFAKNNYQKKADRKSTRLNSSHVSISYAV